MSLSKEQKIGVRSKIQLTWPNADEKEYLLGLLAADGVKECNADNTPTPVKQEAPKKKEAPKPAAKKEEKKPEAPKAPEGSPQENTSAGDPNAGKPVTTSEGGSPGVITDEEAKKALEQ